MSITKKLYNSIYISNIADAIREKTGSTDTFLLSEMSQAILDIEPEPIKFNTELTLGYNKDKLTATLRINQTFGGITFNNPLKDNVIKFYDTDNILLNSATTNSNGVCYITATSSQKIKAVFDGTNFFNQAIAFFNNTLEVEINTTPFSTTYTHTITVKDSFNNPIPNANVLFDYYDEG